MVLHRLHTGKLSAGKLLLTKSMLVSQVVRVSTVTLRSISSQQGTGYEFVNNIVGGNYSKGNTDPAADQGIQGAMLSVLFAGYNVVDVKLSFMMVLIMKSTHQKAFKIAGSMAFKNAMKKADPVLLEPIAKVTVITLRNTSAM